MTEKARVGIVIVNYRAGALCLRCVQSLRTVGRRDPVFLIENSPQVELLPADLAGLGVESIHPGANLGFAGGCNLGIRRALDLGYDYVFLLNPDTRLESDCIAPLVEAMEEDHRIGAMNPVILDDDEGRSIQYAGGHMRWWSGGPKHNLWAPPNPSGWVATDFVTGCALLLRTSAIQGVGPLDQGYFLYFEDADYGERLRHAGWSLAYHPGASLRHAMSSSTGFQSEPYVYYFSRNRLRFLARWAPRPDFLCYCLIHIALKLPATLAIFGLRQGRWRLPLAFLVGIRDAVLGRVGPYEGA